MWPSACGKRRQRQRENVANGSTVSEQRVEERNGNRHPFGGDRLVGNNSNSIINKRQPEEKQYGEEVRNEEEDKRGEERLQSDERSLKSVQ